MSPCFKRISFTPEYTRRMGCLGLWCQRFGFGAITELEQSAITTTSRLIHRRCCSFESGGSCP